MRRGSAAKKVGLVLLGAALAAGFYGVLEKRFAEGGIYPHYASYRSDPLGTSALYESLEGLEGLSVSRNVTNLQTVKGLDSETVLLLLGYPVNGIDDLRAPDDSPVMKAVSEGARLVLTVNPGLVPEVYQPARSEVEDDWIERRRRIRDARKGEGKESAKDAEKEAEDRAEKTEEEEEKEIELRVVQLLGGRLTAKLGFEVTSPSFERPEEGWETEAGEALPVDGEGVDLPLWKSQYRLESKDESWRPALLVDGTPVVLERSYGKGSVVVASDTYFASNESLHFGAGPEFLLWLLGGKTKVVFDETIHGSTETGGAMKLIRRYRAHGVFFGLLVFLALWAWRSASPLVSGSEASDRGLGSDGTVMGEETGTGFIRLLRRSVAPAALLERCVEIWSGSSGSGAPSAARDGVGKILARHRSDPKQFGAVEAYRAIADLLRKR